MGFMGDISAMPNDGQRPKLTLNWRGKTEAVPDIRFVDVTEPAAPPVVKQAERVLAVTPWSEPDGLDICLDRWQAWMHRNDTDMSVQTMKTLQGDGDGYGSDETGAMRRNNEIGEATDAMIRSLKMSHRWAIRKKCGMATEWQFPQLDFMTESIDACCELEKKLRVNIATRLLFG